MPLQLFRQQLARIRGAGTVRRSTATWDPAATAATQGAEVTTTIAVPGAVVGDPVLVGHTGLGALAAVLKGRVSSAGVVTVHLVNTTAVAVDLPTGTLTVVVFSAY